METNNDGQLIQHYIHKHSLKEILSDDLLDRLTLHRYKTRDYLVKSKDPLKYLLFLVEGKAKVFMSMENGKSLLMRFFEPFDLIGDVEFACQDPYICNLQAITEVICLGLDVNLVKSSISENTNLLLFICKTLGRKMVALDTAAAINQVYPLENRFASYLTAITDHLGDNSGIIKELYAENLTELASLLGTSYRQLTRVIKKFKDKGILERKGNEFIVLDQQQINELSCDIYN